jgi:hypothetical protein
MPDEFLVDLEDHELTRRALIAEAAFIDDMAASEAQAWKMLYSELDDNQQQVYDMLIEKGVIPGGLDGAIYGSGSPPPE